ncbi:MAG: aminoglycoside phosphotransferase [Paenibacillaceae bacterium]|jgi:Ser/Thr protein kinase RdoA (MazF antagonist)|nr:aminoglycoside phosphotransferase [Paenibacillaceae bacterium]
MDAQEWIREAVARFFGNVQFAVAASAGGMNNTTVKITVEEKSYMLRRYNTHQDVDKAEFEHAVLRRLSRPGNGSPLSFRVPEPVLSLEGASVIRLREGGRLAAAFRYIEGCAPDFREEAQAAAFGAAAGELVVRMSGLLEELGTDARPAYPPYYELGLPGGTYSLPEAIRFCMAPPPPFALQDYGGDLALLAHEMMRIGEEAVKLKELPHQLIHGDLNASNALARNPGTASLAAEALEGRGLAALLDFEFATRDLRAMEPAVCLWGLLPSGGSGGEEAASGHNGAKWTGDAASHSGAECLADGGCHIGGECSGAGSGRNGAEWAALTGFWRGFCSKAALTAEEREAVPLLMQLRSLDVFLHFMGRFQDGVEGSGVLAALIPETAARMRWVAANRPSLLELVHSR